MKIRGHLLKACACGIILLHTLSLSACGTILYPERRGQTGGRIDPAVAILDGVGLIVFLVPGLFAFAIDFATGAIYLPGGKRAALPPGNPSLKEMEQLLSNELNHPFSFKTPELQAYALSSTNTSPEGSRR